MASGFRLRHHTFPVAVRTSCPNTFQRVVLSLLSVFRRREQRAERSRAQAGFSASPAVLHAVSNILYFKACQFSSGEILPLIHPLLAASFLWTHWNQTPFYFDVFDGRTTFIHRKSFSYHWDLLLIGWGFATVNNDILGVDSQPPTTHPTHISLHDAASVVAFCHFYGTCFYTNELRSHFKCGRIETSWNYSFAGEKCFPSWLWLLWLLHTDYFGQKWILSVREV